jgi:DNA-3-methyladenine glycosylase
MKSGALSRKFYDTDALTLAPQLLNKVLVVGECAGRIVEVEAYMGADDPASHAFRGKTQRNAVMFGPPGFLYVYFTYGMHFCCNVVCGEEGIASAVLIRALEPLRGTEVMWTRRLRAKSDRDLTNGPAKLCEALGIKRDLDGADLVEKDRDVEILFDGMKPPADPAIGPRIGIKEGKDLPWRYWVKENSNISR